MLAADLMITEVVATGSALRDRDGDPADWIEIHNPTDQPVQLLGWSLTDDPNALSKWKFPQIQLPPGGYEIVWASDKDRAQDSFLLTRDFNSVANGTFLVDLDEGVYDVRLTLGDTERARDGMAVFIQGQQRGVLDAAAGEFVVATYRAEVTPADHGQLAIRLEDIVVTATNRAVLNALTITPLGAGNPRWFDFGTATSPVELGTTRITATDTYSAAISYGWQAGDSVTGQDRGTASNDLHTNFKLASEGDYLALIKPDGATIAFEYAPQYPPQQLGASYGLQQAETVTTPIVAGAQVKVLVPTAANGGLALGKSWTQIDFDDSSWLVGPTGIGYERGTELKDLIATDLDQQMFGVNATAYVRIPFDFGRSEKVFSLLLRMKYDDGYVAYVNGEEVARASAPANPGPNSTAQAPRQDTLALQYEDADISPYIGLLRDGPNMLAIQLLNHTATDEDVLLVPELHAHFAGEPASTTPRYFATPTPRAPNGDVSYGDWMATPNVNVEGGLFDAPVDVQVATDTPGATLVVTTDRSRPTLAGGIQSVARNPQTPPPPITIHVDQTTVVRTASFRPDALPSLIENRTLIFPDDVITQDVQATLEAGFPTEWVGYARDYGLDPDVVGPNDLFDGRYAAQLPDALRAVPTLSIVTDFDNLFGPRGIYDYPTMQGFDWERPTSVELLLPDGTTGFRIDAGLRIAGDNVRNHANSRKKSFRLAFRSQWGPGKLDYPLFGADATDSFDTIVLRGSYNDGWMHTPNTSQHIRDEWLRRTVLEMGQASAHGTFMHLYLNGIYWGLYNAVERPDASFLATYFGGDKDEWDAIRVGEAINGTMDAWRELVRLAADVSSSDPQVSNAAYQRIQGKNPDGTDNPDLEVLLDVENYIDYLIANFYGGNTDWPGRNWRTGRQRGPDSTGFKFFVWDAEKILNHGEGSSLFTNVTGQGGGVAQPYSMLRYNEEFRLLFADRIHRHFFNGGALYVDPENPQWDPEHPERNVPAARYQALSGPFELPLVGEMARWGDTARPWLPEGAHDGLYTIDEWAAFRADLFNTYFPQRSARVLRDFRESVFFPLYPKVDAPSYNQHGGDIAFGFQLTMTGPGPIYYTLDGSDPRRSAFQGGPGIADSAILYDSSVTLTENALVKARALVNGEWSALNKAYFTVGAPALRVSEIMYHPHNPTGGNPFGDANEFEFVELVNTSAAAAIELEGVQFTRGIDFTFPAMVLAPGQQVVVVRNQAAFASRYGAGILIAGQYGTPPNDSKLSNGGETLRLADPSGTLIQQFAYGDAWHPTTDGVGFSLELLDPAQADLDQWNEAAAWLPSIVLGGTPGAARSSATAAKGDMNLDGQVDLDDTKTFVLGLAAAASYQARFGVPATLAGDMDGDGDLDFDDIDDFVSLLGPGANRAAQTTQAHTSVRRQRTLRMPIAMSSGSELRGAARDARAAPDVTTDPAAVAAQRVDTFYTRLGRALSRRERHPDLVSVKQVTRRAVQREILPSVEYQLGYDTRFLG